jgi:putative SOS response-associated peptidase YedK
MCGRYVRKNDAECVHSFFEVSDIRATWTPSYNIAPTTQIPVIRQTGASREIVEMKWGLRPAWATAEKKLPLMHNARAETVASLPSYRSAFKARRCIVPASGYFEWMAGTPKQPFYFERADGNPVGFAGIWEHNETEGSTVSIITTSPNAEAGKVHDRMPVILRRGFWKRWFESDPLSDEERQQMLVPAPDGALRVVPVSRDVGNVRVNHVGLITPL